MDVEGPRLSNLVFRILCVAVPLVTAITGFRSRILADWWLENLVVALFFLALVSSRRHVPLTTVSYFLLFAFLCLHEFGAAYSYSDVPLGEWMKPLLGTQRNHYDRLVHFLYGLMVLKPAWEAVRSLAPGLANRLLDAFAIQFILATSAIYEMIEWLVATTVDPQLGTAFIGAQGDPWDSPEDMAMAFLGALAAWGILLIARRRDTLTGNARTCL